LDTIVESQWEAVTKAWTALALELVNCHQATATGQGAQLWNTASAHIAYQTVSVKHK